MISLFVSKICLSDYDAKDKSKKWEASSKMRENTTAPKSGPQLECS